MPKIIRKDLDELQYLISDIANSVNAMAWHSNRFRLLLDETAVFMELKKLNCDVRRFIRKRINQQRKAVHDKNMGDATTTLTGDDT